MRFFDADAVHSLLGYPGLMEGMRQAHQLRGPDAAHMVRDDPGGGSNKFVVLVGWRGGAVIAVKMVGVFPGNLSLSPPQPSVQGLVAVFNGATGAPVLAADGAAMSSARRRRIRHSAPVFWRGPTPASADRRRRRIGAAHYCGASRRASPRRPGAGMEPDA